MPGPFTLRRIHRLLKFALALVVGVTFANSISLADWRDDVGYDQLSTLLGSALPNGNGVPISLVEAQQMGGTAYYPNEIDAEFTATADPLGVAVNFIDGTGNKGNGNSNHAFDQARNFFGNNMSVAPAANEVTVYEANDYLNDILNLNSNVLEPDPQDFRVQNFSWVGTFTGSGGTVDTDRKALRKFDFVIERDNITAVVGLGNGLGALPHFLGHSYNSIAVGRSDAHHSIGLTRLADYGVGRSKPDLVAPRTSTSLATSSTSSVATFLHSSDTVSGSNAAQSETMKAILLAGARKDTLPSWSQIDGGGTWRPLDDTYGAGELSVYNSYAITAGGSAAGAIGTPTPVGTHGWDYQTIQPGSANELLYDFVIPTGKTATELSIVLTWNAEVSSPFNSGVPVLADLNLELVDSLGATIDTDLGDTYVDGLSESDVDNVEHIYLNDLSPGTYTLKVSSEDLAADFGLAWRTTTAFDTFSADFDQDGDTDGRDFLAWQLGYGKIVNATLADGDSDGDGDVDATDLAFLQTELAAVNPSLAVSLFGVPEPSAIALASSAMLFMLSRRVRRAAD